MDYHLDEIDRRILYRLAGDARNVSAPAIAEEVDVSPGTIRNRIDRMEAAGVVRGYHADVDYERTGEFFANLFMCTAPVAERERLAKQVLEIPGVVNVREIMTGRENLHVMAVGTDTHDITRIARDLANLGLEIDDEGLVQGEEFHPYHPFGPGEEAETSGVQDFMRLTGGAEVVELTVSEDAPAVDRTLATLHEEGILPDDALVISIERGDDVITPRGDSKLRPDDLVTVFSRGGMTDEVAAVFTGETGP